MDDLENARQQKPAFVDVRACEAEGSGAHPVDHAPAPVPAPPPAVSPAPAPASSPTVMRQLSEVTKMCEGAMLCINVLHWCTPASPSRPYAFNSLPRTGLALSQLQPTDWSDKGAVLQRLNDELCRRLSMMCKSPVDTPAQVSPPPAGPMPATTDASVPSPSSVVMTLPPAALLQPSSDISPVSASRMLASPLIIARPPLVHAASTPLHSAQHGGGDTSGRNPSTRLSVGSNVSRSQRTSGSNHSSRSGSSRASGAATGVNTAGSNSLAGSRHASTRTSFDPQAYSNNFHVTLVPGEVPLDRVSSSASVAPFTVVESPRGSTSQTRDYPSPSSPQSPVEPSDPSIPGSPISTFTPVTLEQIQSMERILLHQVGLELFKSMLSSRSPHAAYPSCPPLSALMLVLDAKRLPMFGFPLRAKIASQMLVAYASPSSSDVSSQYTAAGSSCPWSTLPLSEDLVTRLETVRARAPPGKPLPVEMLQQVELLFSEAAAQCTHWLAALHLHAFQQSQLHRLMHLCQAVVSQQAAAPDPAPPSGNESPVLPNQDSYGNTPASFVRPSSRPSPILTRDASLAPSTHSPRIAGAHPMSYPALPYPHTRAPSSHSVAGQGPGPGPGPAASKSSPRPLASPMDSRAPMRLALQRVAATGDSPMSPSMHSPQARTARTYTRHPSPPPATAGGSTGYGQAPLRSPTPLLSLAQLSVAHPVPVRAPPAVHVPAPHPRTPPVPHGHNGLLHPQWPTHTLEDATGLADAMLGPIELPPPPQRRRRSPSASPLGRHHISPV